MSKTLIRFAAVLALTFGMAGCGNKAPSEKASDAAKSAGQATSDAAAATGNAIGDASKATGEFLTESKDTTIKAAQESLNWIEQKWQDLQVKAAPTTEEAKADFQKAKDQMAQTLADAKVKLVEAKDASADAWKQNVKPALDGAIRKAKKIYEDTAAWFAGK